MFSLAPLNSSSANQPIHTCYLYRLNCLQSFLWPVWTPNCNYCCMLEANKRNKAKSNGQPFGSPIWCIGWNLSLSPSTLQLGQKWDGSSRSRSLTWLLQGFYMARGRNFKLWCRRRHSHEICCPIWSPKRLDHPDKIIQMCLPEMTSGF